MTTYKLFRLKKNKLYPMFVYANEELPIGVWLDAKVGELKDETHIKSRLGALALRPGFHSCTVPFTDWIGKKSADGTLHQRNDTVWCECEVEGAQLELKTKYGMRTIPEGWYYFKTKPKQPFPWIISKKIKINRILTQEEVEKICCENGVKAQPICEEIK
jgi:hypothetical protein